MKALIGDALTALVDWVEKGKAPDAIIASVDPANKEVASWSPNRTRPLCPWPKYARYRSGEVESAASFDAVSRRAAAVSTPRTPRAAKPAFCSFVFQSVMRCNRTNVVIASASEAIQTSAAV